VSAADDHLRSYPNRSLAAHVLGFANTEERELADHLVTEMVGRDGIEQTLNAN